MKKIEIKYILVFLVLVAVLAAPFFIFRSRAQFEPEDFNYLKILNPSNFEQTDSFDLFDDQTGYKISNIDLGGDGTDELLLGSQKNSAPKVMATNT